MVTTIQVSEDLQRKLSLRKLFDKETYEEVILDLLEDVSELSEETKKNIARSRAEIKAGKIHTLEDVKKELGF